MMKSYLGGTASVQNRNAKPRGRVLRERSQGGLARGRHEEARALDLAGGPLSPNAGRVSLPWTKPSLHLIRSSWPTTNAVRWPGGKVLPALMPGKGFFSLTDEVPRSSSLALITGFYKALPKGSHHAPAAGTATPWPRPRGCLQRQSKASAEARKAKPQSASNASSRPWDKLASAKKRSPTATAPLPTARLGGSSLAPSAWTPPSWGSALSFTGIARARVRSGSPDAGKLHVRQI
jgi:hypothetical protein